MEDHQQVKKTVVGYPANKEQEPFPPMSMPTTAVPSAGSPSNSSTKLDEDDCRRVYVIVFTMLFMLFICFIALFSAVSSSRLPNFEINQLVVFPFSVSSSNNLTTNWALSISVIKKDTYSHNRVYCEDGTASVFYKDENISTASVKPFFIYREHKVLVPVNSGVSTTHINGSVADAIVADWKNGAVKFTVVMNLTARIIHSSSGDGKSLGELTVSCKDIRVVFSSRMKNAGTMLAESRKCKARFV